MRKRNLKSFAVSVGVCAFALLQLTVSGEKMVMEDDFQGYSAGQLIQKGGNYELLTNSMASDKLEIANEGGNLYMKAQFSGKTARKQYFGKDNINFAEEVKLSFRVKPVKGKRTDISIETDGFEKLSLMRFYDGKIYMMSGMNETEAGKYKENVWYDVSVVISDGSMKVTVGGYSRTAMLPLKLIANQNLYFVMNNHGYSCEVHWDDIKLEYDKITTASVIGENIDYNLNDLKVKMQGLEAYSEGSPRFFNSDGVAMMTDSREVICYENASGELMLPTAFVNEYYNLNYTEEYVSIYEVGKDMNKFTYYDAEFNNWILGSRIDPFNGDSELRRDIARRIRYPRPSGETVVKDIFDNNGFNTHPRILATADDFERIKELVKTDELAKKWYDSIKKATDKYIQSNVNYSALTAGNYDMHKSLNLAFMYKMTGDEIYAEEMWKYCNTFAQFDEWKPTNTIDTASVAAIMAIGYDWCYDYFNDNQKAIITNAVFEKALVPADAVYRGDFMNCGNFVTWWPNCDHNWNFACNGGFGIAALAFAEQDEELAKRILDASIKGIEGGMESYGDNGGWDESITYWKYGTQYLYQYLQALDSATGVDYGYMDIPYIGMTSLFPMYMSTKNGVIGYGDGDPHSLLGINELSYAAKKQKDKGYLNLRIHQIDDWDMPVRVEDLLFYTPDGYEKESEWELDAYFDTTETLSFKGSWVDPFTTHVSLHGGLNYVNHGQLDIGTFTLDALGERWFCELGNDSYGFEGYHDRTIGGLRWNYYRCRAEGSNTLVINPGSGPDQDPAARGQVTKFVTGDDGGYAIMDMKAAYSDVKSLYRGIKLYDNRSKVIVQDEIEATKPSEIYWFGHTTAEIEVLENKKTAILTSGGKKLQAQIISPSNGEFSVMEAKALPTSPEARMGDNSKYRKLTVHLQNVLNARIEIALIPLPDGEITAELPKNQAMSKWYVSGEESDANAVSAILVGNEEIEEFSFHRNHYTRGVYSIGDGMPEISVKTGDGYIAEIKQSADIYTPAVVNIKDSAGRKVENYYVYFERRGLPVSVHSVSSEPEVENGRENVLDGSTLTRWASLGDNEWIILDLGEEKDISTVAMSWFNGNQRISYFDIDTSLDCENWSRVYKGQSSGNSNNSEFFEFEKTKARYVRVNCHGTSAGQWNSITTLDIFAP